MREADAVRTFPFPSREGKREKERERERKGERKGEREGEREGKRKREREREPSGCRWKFEQNLCVPERKPFRLSYLRFARKEASREMDRPHRWKRGDGLPVERQFGPFPVCAG